MDEIRIEIYRRIFTICAGGLILCLAATVSLAAPKQKVVILDIRIENDIGIQNADAIVTRWLTDSVARTAPHIQLVKGKQAAQLARLQAPLKAYEITPSDAWSLRKSIGSTHVLGGEIFLWNGKYSITLRMTELSNLDRTRVERAWADSVDDIPARIEDLTQALFSTPKMETARDISTPDFKKETPKKGVNEVVPNIPLLLRMHPEMVYVPGGNFLIGNDNDSDAYNMPVDPARREGVSRLALLAAEKPEHTVHLEPFLIDKCEVTNADYAKFRPDHDFPPDRIDHPVTGISWHDARAYAKWAGKRLPTEEEWEKAARGIDGRKWPWGNIFDRRHANLGTDTAPVGSYQGDMSPYGAFDMAGNVQEWTSSDFIAYSGNQSEKVNFDRKKKVVRGSYYNGNDFLARCSMRFCALPGQPGAKPQEQNYTYIGFRCALDLE